MRRVCAFSASAEAAARQVVQELNPMIFADDGAAAARITAKAEG